MTNTAQTHSKKKRTIFRQRGFIKKRRRKNLSRGPAGRGAKKHRGEKIWKTIS